MIGFTDSLFYNHSQSIFSWTLLPRLPRTRPILVLVLRLASESESELLYDWRFTANQFVLAISPLGPTTRIFIFQLNTCGCSPYVTPYLTRGWICRLQLLLVLASTIILRSESRGIHGIICCLIFETPPTWKARSLYIYPPGTRWPSYTPRHWVPFSSPPTTRRVTVEVC
jgi:hypothetical protein